MATTEQTDFLNEHGPCELRLLRHALRGMVRNHGQRTDDELWDYNAYFECFAVKARAAADFLTNKWYAGNKNFLGSQFVRTWQLKAPPRIHSLLTKLEGHAIHFGKRRTKNQAEKFTLVEGVMLADWIEDEIANFLGALSSAD